MVTLVDIRALARLLDIIGLERFLAELSIQIEDDVKRWPVFEKSARLASHSRCGVIELMPTSDGSLFAFKFVNGHPANTKEGLLSVTAFGALASVNSGYPLLISEMTILTAMRTAATSALAARYLARKSASCMAVIGTGAQAEFQALAFKVCLGIKAIRFFDVDPSAMSKFADNLRESGLALTQCKDVASAIQGADIVTTATAAKSAQRLLTASMVGPGVHINAIGGDCPGKTEIAPDLLEKSRVFVEFEPQTRIEGDIQQLPAEASVTELWRVVTGQAPGRTNDDEITVFDSVGFAVEDFATLRFINELLRKYAVAIQVELVPTPQNPKDLFGYLQRRRAPFI